MTTQCSCCGTPLKNVFYFEGKAYGSTCIGYVSGAIPYISYMTAYGVNSIEEAKELLKSNQEAAQIKVNEYEAKIQARKAQGDANGEVYEMVVNHAKTLNELDQFAGFFESWINTLETTSLSDLTENQQSALSKVYAQIAKANGVKGKKDDLAWEFGVKTFGWEESIYDIALAKLKKMKFEVLQELAIKCNIDEAADCENNRSDIKYLRDSLKDNLELVVNYI